MISIPFRGAKIYSYNRQVKPIAEAGGYDTVLEPFGGSAVLSVNLKRDGVVDTAVINDYDRLWERYPEFLDIKDWLVSECYKKGLRRTTCSKNGKFRIEPDGTRTPVSTCLLDKNDKKILMDLVAKIDKKWWPLLSLGSCFTYDAASSQNAIKLKNFKYFRNGLGTEKAREYLKAVKACEVMSLDWRDFLKANRGRFGGKTLIILDPPYTGANPGVYKSQRSYTLNDLAELVSAVKNTGCDFILFNYGMDDIRDLLLGFGLNPDRLEYTGLSGGTVSRSSQDVLAYVRRADDSKINFSANAWTKL